MKIAAYLRHKARNENSGGSLILSSHDHVKGDMIMQLYNINDEYIEYLEKFEDKILYNKKKKRPYVGVVYNINSIKYYVPLASPKDKFIHMSNTKDFHKIKNGEYGAINFNKMLPVRDEDLTEIIIKNESDIAYKNLLNLQYLELIKLEKVIIEKAKNIYLLYNTPNDKLTQNDLKIKERCCNFILLEEKLKEYINKNKND
jgi:protein AbiQ